MSAQIEIKSDYTGILTCLPVSAGATVAAGDTVAIVESMKMELPVTAPVAGIILSFRMTLDATVSEGDVIAILGPA